MTTDYECADCGYTGPDHGFDPLDPAVAYCLECDAEMAEAEP